MERTTRLCDALLPNVQNRAVADVLFARSSGGRHDEAVSVVGGLSDELALKHYKGDAKRSITIVRTTTSPVVLAKYSKDPRVHVRRAVAASPHISTETAVYLHNWALGKSDQDILSAVLPKTPWKIALEGAVSNHERGYPWQQLAVSLATPRTAEPYLAALELREQLRGNLYVWLAKQMVVNPPEGYQLREYVAKFSESGRTTIIGAAASEVRTLTAEMVGMLDGVGESLSRSSSRLGSFLPQVRDIDADAITPILDSEHEFLWVTLAGTNVSPRVVHQLLAKNSTAVAETILRQKHRTITSLMAERMAPALAAGGQAWAVTEVLNDPKLKLSTDTVLTLLRAGNGNITLEWLMGQLHVKPRKGETQALCAAAGTAFTSYSRSSFYYRTHKYPETTLPDIASRIAVCMPSIVKKPWGAEVVDALGGEFFALITKGAMGEYMAARLERAFEARVDLWETALTLADSWTGSFTELLEACYLMQGEMPPSSAALTPIITEPAISLGQIELFSTP